MMTTAAGYTFIEVLVASLIASVVASGTLMAFVTSARITRSQDSPQFAEASLYGQQTIEGFRNLVAADDQTLHGMTPGLWRNDALPGPGGAGSESIRTIIPAPQRRYCIIRGDCDNDGIVAGFNAGQELDCYQIVVRVCWDGTVCPAAGTACP